MSEVITIGAFIITYVLTRKSIGLGLSAVCWIGALYGIYRANNLTVVAYFTFDASLCGIYWALLPRMLNPPQRARGAYTWTVAIVFWPLICLGMGFFRDQHPLIQMVGLRAAIWFAPFIMVGALMTYRDIYYLTNAVALMNIVTLGFAVLEYEMGIEAFYPRNSATEIIYNSNDVAGHSAYRIPATFSHAASYGAYLAASSALLIARLADARLTLGGRMLALGGLASALLGVFICGSRTPVVTVGVIVGAGLAVILFVGGVTGQRRVEIILVVAAMIAGTIYKVSQEERLQRITTLSMNSTETVNRVSALSFTEVLAEYPLGVGLGGAYGTNIPAFLMEYAPIQVGAENELGRIALEQTPIGLFLWFGFLFSIVRMRILEGADVRMWVLVIYVVFSWATCYLGCGLLAAIPSTAMLLTYMGFVATTVSRSGQAPQIPAGPRRQRAPT
jgi:hypothetical protein